MANSKKNQKGKTSGSANKGFGSVDDIKQKEIAGKGEKASHGSGTSGRSSKSQADTDELETVDIEDNDEDPEEQSGL